MQTIDAAALLPTMVDREGPVPAKILNIDNLADRHYGVTPALGSAYTEAATVCLARHHSSPVEFNCNSNGTGWLGQLGWIAPSARVTAAFANAEEATRDGAYAVSLAALEAAEGLVAVARAEKLTGADYYLAPGDGPQADLEAAYRLEVSGTDTDNQAAIRQRLREKVAQTQAGNSNLPAIASVVGFRLRQLELEKVNGP